MRFLVKGMILFTVILSLGSAYLLGKSINESMQMAKTSGLFFMLLGLILRYWTYVVTKTYFTRGIHHDEERPLYSHGPFRLHRHPYQTGFFFIVLGVTLFMSGHWLVLIVTFTLLGSALHYRMSLEERILQNRYGEIYEYWCRHRFRIFPFLY
ncbi:methyltransferase family protein [Alteribacter populi]|uniref:methyltransferase family protein n=1 Tax=Alteribacter populi TaxID=2011011 RepID=UPI0012FE04FB|nr:methyltransferase [Alteribacter populi]